MSARGVTVDLADAADDALVAAINHLLPQLSPSAPAVTADDLHDMITSPLTSLLVARVDGDVVGCLTLVVFRTPRGVRAWIEDVVVDTAARGAGVGQALTEAALDRAAALGAPTVDLTSRPMRAAAHRLYERVGFVRRETTVFRYELPG